MKKIVALIFLVMSPVYLLGGVVFQKAEGRGNIVTWKTADESQVKYFLIFRRELQSGNTWGPPERVRPDLTITAQGGSGREYSVEDTGIFKSANRLLEYEIQAINAQGVVVESIKYATALPSGVTSAAKRTWGSIKAMFR